MGSNFDFKNSGNDQPDAGGKPPCSFSLTRQPSVYSLTFDEFQTTVGGIGKDFGSMNMDELLKSIWSADDDQNFGSTSGGGDGDGNASQQGGGSLQKQGSIILPRTLSRKTVDEVWRDMSKEYDDVGEKDSSSNVSRFGVLPQRQQTLGEITLEEFLVRAGVVREEDESPAKPTNNLGFFTDSWDPSFASSNIGFGEFSNPVSLNLPLNVNGLKPVDHHHHHHRQQQQQHQQHILPKPTTSSCGSQIGISGRDQLTSPGIRGGIGIPHNAMLQAGGVGMVGLGGTTGVGVREGSPGMSSDGLSKSNGDKSHVLPVPCAFNGGLRGKRSSPVEKGVERRQRRMIKNRESAARSRARKRAYTDELQAEVEELKAEHKELKKKQADIKAMQKNQVLEMMKLKSGGKRQCLRRTQTSPW
ncbi:ARM REPEAT PROTEIN INTERACTING WITH abf2 [Orobanche gracilis]